MWSTMQPRWRVASVIVMFLFIILLMRSNMSSSSSSQFRNTGAMSFGFSGSKSSANSTLGFQKIIAVSGEDPAEPLSWRRKGMVAAANRTGVILHIEETHKLSDAEIDYVHNITLQSGKHPKGGSAKAWAAHTRVLRQIVKERITSALIFEDDVDWELGVKQQLAPNGDIATAIRRLSVSDPNLDIVSWPYGDNYDVLWIGHCGRRWHGKHGPTSWFNITFPDPLVFPMDKYAHWDSKPLEGVPEGHRQVRLGGEVLCSLAYAITLKGAEALLRRLDDKPGHGAFDIELNDSCQYGTVRCLTINPEIMHDQGMQGGRGSLINSKHAATAKNYEDLKPITWNIRYSARCNAGFDQNNIQQCLPKRLREAQELQWKGKGTG